MDQLTQEMVDMLLRSTSLRFDKEISALWAREKHGQELVPLFLETTLRDSCSPEVRAAFVRAILSQAKTMQEQGTLCGV